MRRNKLNRVVFLMLAAGILLTIAVNSAIAGARRRRAGGQNAGPAEIAESAAGAGNGASEGENYGPGYQIPETEEAADSSETSSGDVHATIGPGGAYGAQTPGSYEDFRRKFRETEDTIARIRASENKNQSEVERQNAASSQLRYWETQMNSVYQTIMSVISTEEAAVLSRDQQDWKKQREKDAAEAARNSAGSRQESTEYTLSQAEATRQRAYELLERYRDRL